jgi:hypothetical protein
VSAWGLHSSFVKDLLFLESNYDFLPLVPWALPSRRPVSTLLSSGKLTSSKVSTVDRTFSKQWDLFVGGQISSYKFLGVTAVSFKAKFPITSITRKGIFLSIVILSSHLWFGLPSRFSNQDLLRTSHFSNQCCMPC